jgi:hypothetical protein
MSLVDNSTTSPLVINFNSKDRVLGTNSSFLSNPVDLGNNKFDSVCLVQASIPKSFYNIPSGYNTFTLKENLTSITITIPPGSYNRINLQSTLASLLTAATVNALTYTVSYPASTSGDTFHYTFTVNTKAIPIYLIFVETSPYRQLGFESNTTYTFTPTPLVTTSTLESVNSLNLSYILRAFIKTNLVSDATDSILEELLNFGSFPALAVMNYQQVNFDMNTRKYNTSSTNSWQFSLVDTFDRLIDLNGIPWAFSVVFYQRNVVHELQKNELRITNEERLFRIEQAQSKIQEQIVNTPSPSATTTESGDTPTQPPAPPQPMDVNELKPLYPVEPWGITTLFLPPENIIT